MKVFEGNDAIVSDYYVLFTTVQLVGIPLFPLGQEVIEAAFTKVPEEEVLLTQLLRGEVVEIFVARHLI